jgi:hypothetical protein
MTKTTEERINDILRREDLSYEEKRALIDGVLGR